MKKKLLFSLIGAVVIFLWQFISFAIGQFHQSAMEYTPLQDEILQKLDESRLEEGMYMLGQPDPSLSQEQMETEYGKYAGKPWAILQYQNNMDMAMAMPMIRGLLVAFVTSFLLFWIFLQQANATMMSRILTAVFIGLIGFLYLPYTNFIWFKFPDIFAYLIDAIVPWVILGFIGHKMAK